MEALYSSPVRIMSAPVQTSRCPPDRFRCHYRASSSQGKIGLSGALLSGVRSIAADVGKAKGSGRRGRHYIRHYIKARSTDMRSVRIGGIFSVQNALHLFEMGD